MKTSGLGLLLVLLAGRGFAQQRPAVVVTLTEDAVPAATVTIRGLLTDQVVNALESGFPLYVRVHAALREPGGLFGGRIAQEADWDYVVLRDPVRNRYAIEEPDTSRTVPSRDSLAYYVGRPLLFGLEPGRPGRYFYLVRLVARTLSDQDVDEAFAWLNGGDNAQVERPGFFTRAARRFLVRVMPLPSFEIEERSVMFVYQPGRIR